MPRNKYPEETVNQILSVSLKLFLQKGYEHTSIQDIIDGLGGLTKGAIYHHFKSKEDIMLAVAQQIYRDADVGLAAIRDEQGLTGLAKLRKLFRASLDGSKQLEIFSAAPNLLNNPKMLILHLQSIIEEAAPLFIQPIIEQGIRDGSIQTDYPKQLAEVMMLLSNLWLNPLVFAVSPEEMLHRCRFFHQLLLGLGLDLLDEQMFRRLEEFCRLSNEKAHPAKTACP